MGKRNRPFVVKIKPGETYDAALKRALSKPNIGKRSASRILVRAVAK